MHISLMHYHIPWNCSFQVLYFHLRSRVSLEQTSSRLEPTINSSRKQVPVMELKALHNWRGVCLQRLVIALQKIHQPHRHRSPLSISMCTTSSPEDIIVGHRAGTTIKMQVNMLPGSLLACRDKKWACDSDTSSNAKKGRPGHHRASQNLHFAGLAAAFLSALALKASVKTL